MFISQEWIDSKMASLPLEAVAVCNELIELFESIDTSSLELLGITAFYARFHDYFLAHEGRRTMYGMGFILPGTEVEEGEGEWLTVSRCWSGEWMIYLVLGKKAFPYGFGPSGLEVAFLPLEKSVYDKAILFIEEPYIRVDKELLLEKYGHKLEVKREGAVPCSCRCVAV